jgi:two-component system nitrogen regulation response regulator GlnG/two-component system response regulator HydG
VPIDDAAPSDQEPDDDEIRACLERCGQNQNQAWRDLGLKNRYVLYRLIKKYGIEVAKGDA